MKIGKREGLRGPDALVGGHEGALRFTHGQPNDDVCRRHSAPHIEYLIRKGTNRCPVGRKRNENCR